jgi:TonB-dependent SusC/RagA subfamily outer membrane receptor
MKKKRLKEIPLWSFFLKLLRLMKVTLFLLCISVFSVMAKESYSQVTRLSVGLRNTDIKSVLEEIESQSEFHFFYSEDVIDAERKVSVNFRNSDIEKILTEIFYNTGVEYKIVGRQVALYKGEFDDANLPAVQQQGVTGTVTGADGQPIPGVTVFVKGSTQGTVTNIDGNFQLSDLGSDAVLSFSFVGMLSQEISVNGRNNISVVMQEDAIGIEEVVVIGYGTRQKKNLVGAVDQVNSDIIEDRPVSNASQALQGASANLIIQQKSMNPNDNNMSINIRGVSTMSNNDPLIVIDGLISGTATLNNLNPNDIENISILKDAGSAAIYGSRSANGVILVTTRKGGKTGKPVVKFSSMVGYQDPDILFQPVQGWENAMLRDQANVNVGNAPIFTPAQIRDLYENRSEEFWYLNEIMDKGLQQNYNMSVSGGNENSTYMISAG